jgi:23S rRNA (guanosine2251-2'-O)-methyltransferase
MPFLHGFHAVREALRHRPHEVRRVLLSGRDGGRRREIESLCARHSVTVEASGREALTALAGDRHRGFLAEVASLEERPTGGDPDLIVLLEDVQDPRNLGALLRVCEGAGVGRVLLRDRGTSALTATVAQTSAGASEWLAVERITNSAQQIDALKKDGFWVYGADAAGEPPWQTDLAGKLVLCLGGEERGLRRRTREHCDALVGLPMRGRIESLNVATAAAALLYEAVRQRS